ncbi:MAG: class I SAM-dependent methyltransferase [Nitrospirae bacterium]|nr:class I SAM-dependent methyltransferase [Nitrospirota bacterium]
MKLNRWEFLMMNNPLREASQRLEWRFIKGKAEIGPVERVLEVGCGRGVGAQIALRDFDPREYAGIDLDERMVSLARQRVKDSRARFEVASATALPFASKQFDVALDFGIIHHIPDYPKALAEIYRVLKPGGRFLLEDLTIDFFNFAPTKILKYVLDHPYDEMFTAEQFRGACRKAGFREERWRSPRGLFILAHLAKPSNK